MRKTLYIILCGLFLLAAITGCSSANASDDPPAEPGDVDLSGEYASGLAVIETLDMLILESFPVQVHAVVEGYLPDGCTEVDEISEEFDGETFTVTVTTRRPVDAMCTEALVPFKDTIPFDVLDLKAGEYRVVVNGVEGSFRLDTDNTLQMDPGAGSDSVVVVAEAPIDSISVSVTDKIVITVGGYLPDGCTKLGDVKEVLTGSTLTISVQTVREKDAMCDMSIHPFETTYTVTSRLEPGLYTLDLNGQIIEFTTE